MAIVACGERAVPTTRRPAAADTVRIPTEALLHPLTIILADRFELSGHSDSMSGGFTDVSDLDVTDNGNVVVLEARQSRVYIYDSLGKSLRKFGRAGGGPGEFQTTAILSLAVTSDTIFVLERALHAFSHDGKLFYDALVDSVGPGEPRRRVENLEHTRNGLVVVRTHTVLTPTREAHSQVDTSVVQARIESNGFFARPGLAFDGVEAFRFGKVYARKMFGGAPSLAVSRDGRLFYSRGGSFEIQVIGSNGTPLAEIISDVPRPRITASEMRAALVARQRMYDSVVKVSAGSFGSFPPLDQSRLPREEFRVLIGQIISGSGDSLLVERPDLSSLERGPQDSTVWALIDASTGGVLGQLNKPAGFVPRVLRNGRIYGLTRDSLGVPSVVWYRLSNSKKRWE